MHTRKITPRAYQHTVYADQSRSVYFDGIATYTRIQVEGRVTVRLNCSEYAAFDMNESSGPLTLPDIHLHSIKFINDGDKPVVVLVITGEH